MPRSKNSLEKKGWRRLKTKEASRIAAKRWADLNGITPLQVMLDNMKDATERARSIEGNTPKKERQRLMYMGVAQEAAKDAAPYVHPKLASITHKGDKENPMAVTIVDDLK